MKKFNKGVDFILVGIFTISIADVMDSYLLLTFGITIIIYNSIKLIIKW